MYIKIYLHKLYIVSNFSLKPSLEVWYDCVKKVIRLWNKRKQALEIKNNGSCTQPDYDEIDDFYLNLYDEEDLSN